MEMLFEPINTDMLFKYRDDSKFTEEIVTKHVLWYRSPFTFNDPFDCWSIVGEGTDEQKARWIARSGENNKLLEFAARNDINTIEQKLEPSLLKRCADATLSQMRICCFSLNCDNILMWSHYAKDHKGMCLMFDVREDISLIECCSKINYVSRITPCNLFSETGRVDLVKNCILSKFMDWKYEEEVRSIRFGAVIQQDKEGQNFKFKPQALKKIIFGCRTSDETIEKYVSLCHEHEMQHVVFSKMKQMEDGTFGLIEEKI